MLFATKKDTNGNRYFLKVTGNTYNTEFNTFAARSDFIEISKRDMETLKRQLANEGYTEGNAKIYL